MNAKTDVLVIGGIVAVGAVLYLILKGSDSSSTGVVFGQANPQSVAAVYAANASDVAANDQAAASVANSKVAANSAIAQSYLSYLGLTNTNATTAGINANTNATTLAENANAGSVAEQGVSVGAAEAENIASTQANSAKAIAASNNSALVKVAGIAGNTAEVESTNQVTATGLQANAEQSIASTQANAAVAQQNAASNGIGGILSGIGGIAKTIIPFFSGAPAAGPQVANTNTTSDSATASAGDPFGLVGGFGEL